MTPDQRAERLVSTLFFERRGEWLRADHGGVSIDADPVVTAVAAAIRAATAAEREACAMACDAIATDKHAQFKGRPPHTPNNECRADPHTEGESDGADLCATAIRARDGGAVGGETG